MRYKVTGGEDGTAGLSVGSRRYEPGDVIELTQPKAAWLVERGLLEPASTRAAKGEPADDTDETPVHNWENAAEDDALEDEDNGGDE